MGFADEGRCLPCLCSRRAGLRRRHGRTSAAAKARDGNAGTSLRFVANAAITPLPLLRPLRIPHRRREVTEVRLAEFIQREVADHVIPLHD